MIASKVTFSKETRLALQSPALDKAGRRALRVARMKDYIREQPAGHKFRKMDLGSAAGFDYTIKREYQAAYNLINRLVKTGEITFDTLPKSVFGTCTIPGDSVTTVAPKHEPQPIKFKVDPNTPDAEQVQKSEDIATKVAEPVASSDRSDRVDFALGVEEAAKEFSWARQSDSLREFVEYLKVNI